MLSAAALPAQAPPANLILRGGAVYTMDASRSWVEAIAIRDGKIAFVGSNAGVREWIEPQTKVLELNGRLVLPGFQDAHVHPVSGGVELGQCNLNGLRTQAQVLDQVRSCAARPPRQGWLVGGGWDLPVFPGANPSKTLLDAIVPDRPVLLSSADGHSAWVNSKALELAGIDAATPNPKDGRIERDPATGEPSGTLRESAFDLIDHLVPEPTQAERDTGLRRALELLNRHGVTAFQEASAGRDYLETYRAAERRGELSAKAVIAMYVDPNQGLEQVERLIAWRREFSSARVHPWAVKLFEDGVIEARTAALLEPYLDQHGQRGEPIWSPERLPEMVARLARADFNVHIHAIGDRAIRLALDAFEAAGREESARGPRHQIAHLELIDPADIGRFRALRVVANFQPLWGYADSYITELTWPVLGPERSRWLYPIASVAAAGGPVAFGSDWSVSSLNPLDGIQVAVTRQSLDGAAAKPLLPEQALSLPAALQAYTIGAAYALGLEQETGSLEVGKAADLVVLSDNLFTVAPHQIARAKVLLTLLDGRPVYRDGDFAGVLGSEPVGLR
jgi:predicted amidohydrolase YtcJ